MQAYQETFLDLAVRTGVLRFGSFTLKSGRISPYFFNMGNISRAADLATLGQCFAQAIVARDIAVDTLFGPAYKGIPLAVATAVALAQIDAARADVAVVFNRKEAKDHGEGGMLVGGPMKGRTLIVDDVITAGTAIRESVALVLGPGIEAEAAESEKPTLAGALVALDRAERAGDTAQSAVQSVAQQYDTVVHSLVDFYDVIEFVRAQGRTLDGGAGILEAMEQYRESYGVRRGN